MSEATPSCIMCRNTTTSGRLLLEKKDSSRCCVVQTEAHASGADVELTGHHEAKRFRRDSSDGGVEFVEEDTSQELDQPVSIVEDSMVDVGAGSDAGSQLFRRRICWKVGALCQGHDVKLAPLQPTCHQVKDGLLKLVSGLVLAAAK